MRTLWSRLRFPAQFSKRVTSAERHRVTFAKRRRLGWKIPLRRLGQPGPYVVRVPFRRVRFDRLASPRRLLEDPRAAPSTSAAAAGSYFVLNAVEAWQPLKAVPALCSLSDPAPSSSGP